MIFIIFGYSSELVSFWHKGFNLVYLSEYKESSSGTYNAMAIYPLTLRGKEFSQQCMTQFRRDFVLSDHPLLNEVINNQTIEVELNAFDVYSLQKFAFYYRTLSAARPALWRLLKMIAPTDCPVLRKYFCSEKDFLSYGGYRQGVIICRNEVKEVKKYKNFL